MAILHRLLSISGETASFLIPIFREYDGANEEVIQRVDDHDHIIALEPIHVDDGDMGRVDWDVEVDIGGKALWVFRDQDGVLHKGNAADVRVIGQRLLSSGLLSKCPMAAAEMAAFCKAEEHYPEILRSAFDTLRQISERSAETWRDAVVLLPIIKGDLEREISQSFRDRTRIGDVFAITRGNITHVYAPPPLASLITRLPRWRVVARIFGIRDFKVHSSQTHTRAAFEEVPAWSLIGIGGVARYVIKRSPFLGSTDNNIHSDGAIAYGPPLLRSRDRGGANHIVIAVVMSDVAHARTLNRSSRGISRQGALRHALNIRPIGFGTPRKDKDSPTAIREALHDFDYIWIIANHRQRQTGSYWNGLSVSNIASRFIKAAAVGLITCFETLEGRDILSEIGHSREFGLFGAARYNSSVTSDEMITRVLYTMLCEDAYLHTASKIFLLWPYKVDGTERLRRVRLGAHDYEVELISRHKTNKNLDVAGFALNVRLSARAESDFRDFCLSLLSGFGWIMRADNGQSILLENEGTGVTVWPVTSTAGAEAVMRLQEKASVYDMIITNQTVSSLFRTRAESKGWSVIHYSEIGRWMRDTYRIKLFSE